MQVLAFAHRLKGRLPAPRVSGDSPTIDVLTFLQDLGALKDNSGGRFTSMGDMLIESDTCIRQVWHDSCCPTGPVALIFLSPIRWRVRVVD